MDISIKFKETKINYYFARIHAKQNVPMSSFHVNLLQYRMNQTKNEPNSNNNNNVSLAFGILRYVDCSQNMSGTSTGWGQCKV